MKWWNREQQHRVLEDHYTDRLPSRDAGIDFTVEVHVIVTASGSATEDPRAEAALHLEPILRKAVADLTVLRKHIAQRSLNAHIARQLPVQLGNWTVTSVIAALSVDDEAADDAQKVQRSQREARLDELARRQTRATMEFLKDECFTDPASARLFLMLHNSPRLGSFPSAEKADEIISMISKWNPEKLWVRFADVLGELAPKLSPTQMSEILMLLETILASSGHHQTAVKLGNLRRITNSLTSDEPRP